MAHQGSSRADSGDYERKIRTIGQDSRDSWIQRIWSHMFSKPAEGQQRQQQRQQQQQQQQIPSDAEWEDEDEEVKDVDANKNQSLPPVDGKKSQPARKANRANQSATNLPPISHSAAAAAQKTRKLRSDETTSSSEDDDERSTSSRRRQRKNRAHENRRSAPQSREKELAPELLFSPYMSLAARERTLLRNRSRTMPSAPPPSQRNGKAAVRTSHPPPRQTTAVKSRPTKNELRKGRQLMSAYWQQALTSQSRQELQAKFSAPKESLKKSIFGPQVLLMEKKAKETAAYAIKNHKIFTCHAPYPIDVYVRYCLRRREWVEKFINQNHASSFIGRGSKYKINLNEKLDFSAICKHSLPAAWEEDNGFYSLQSRVVRHSPVRFLWGNRSVARLVLKNEVIVNHFGKARHYSSKTGLTSVLRELQWQNSADPNEFFPRCYQLTPEDEQDFVDDYRLTACISLLKWASEMHTNKDGTDRKSNLLKDDEVTGEESNAESEEEDDHQEEAAKKEELQTRKSEIEKEEKIEKPEEKDIEEADDMSIIQQSEIFVNKKKVRPEIIKMEKAGGKVGSRAIDHALFHLRQYKKFRAHQDLDGKKLRQLTASQWKELQVSFYKVAQDGAEIEMSRRKLRECRQMVSDFSSIWTQCELDGLRNIWIVKPGDMAKGKGIEFCYKLEEIKKYISSETQSNYVVQKYIETPLLIYNCKFDIRQWFLVTDWNPLTVWLYKDSYLRICSQEFSYDSLHEAVHLSNVAVQENYVNGERNEKLPENNFLTSNEFIEYLREQGQPDVWQRLIYPGMKRSIINCLLATLDISESKRSAFELYGADFMISEDFRPWLLEINASPGMAPTSVEKAKLCYNVVEDTVRVVLDRRENKSAEVGRYELIYRDSAPSDHKCIDNKILVEGLRLKKGELLKLHQLDENMSKQMHRDDMRQERIMRRKLQQEANGKPEIDASSSSTSSSQSSSPERQPAAKSSPEADSPQPKQFQHNKTYHSQGSQSSQSSAGKNQIQKPIPPSFSKHPYALSVRPTVNRMRLMKTTKKP